MNPVFLLVLAIVAVYAPVTMKAVSIGRKKKEIKKAAVAQARGEKVTMPDPIVIKPGPGRPPGTTKENLAAKKEADQKK